MPEAGETVGRQFRAERLRSTPPLPATSFPATLPENSLPLLPHSFSPSLSPSSATASPTSLLTVPWPLTLPTFHRLAHPPGSGYSPRNLKMYSGGDRRWLRCSFECFIYCFLSFTSHIAFVFSKSSHYLLKWGGIFMLLPQWKQIDSLLTNTHLWCFPEVFVRM